MRVSETLERSWPTRPAEWNVEPLVSSLRSSRTTSCSPRPARWCAIEAPPTPPPMMTTRARSGSSRALATVRSRLALRARQPVIERRLLDGGLQPVEVLAPVALEVEIELGDLALHDAPRGLARIGHHAHQLQRRSSAVAGRRSVVGAEKPLVGGLVEVVVDRQVAEVKPRVAHPRVLPVDDQDAPAVRRED